MGPCKVQPLTWNENKSSCFKHSLYGKPLYKISEFYETQDPEMLFGPNVTPEKLNDDALGRALDYLYEADAWKVYSTLALITLKKLGLSIGVLHNDTTSISVYGQYHQAEEEDVVNITYGYSKSHRPDLKQIVLGMCVTPERIPVLAKVENGNTSDKTWNLEFIKRMREILSDEDWSRLIYQADSALITSDNLAELDLHNLAFISRLPDMFSLSAELKKEAWAHDVWEELGQLSDKKGAAKYKIQSFERSLETLPYRFIVVHSDNLDQRKAKTLTHAIEKEEMKLQKAFDQLQKVVFHCESDALEAIQEFKKKHKSSYFHYELAIHTHEQPVKRKKRGRPKKEEQPEMEIVYHVRLHSFEKNIEFIEEKKRLLSTLF